MGKMYRPHRFDGATSVLQPCVWAIRPEVVGRVVGRFAGGCATGVAVPDRRQWRRGCNLEGAPYGQQLPIQRVIVPVLRNPLRPERVDTHHADGRTGGCLRYSLLHWFAGGVT